MRCSAPHAPTRHGTGHVLRCAHTGESGRELEVAGGERWNLSNGVGATAKSTLGSQHLKLVYLVARATVSFTHLFLWGEAGIVMTKHHGPTHHMLHVPMRMLACLHTTCMLLHALDCLRLFTHIVGGQT